VAISSEKIILKKEKVKNEQSPCAYIFDLKIMVRPGIT